MASRFLTCCFISLHRASTNHVFHNCDPARTEHLLQYPLKLRIEDLLDHFSITKFVLCEHGRDGLDGDATRLSVKSLMNFAHVLDGDILPLIENNVCAIEAVGGVVIDSVKFLPFIDLTGLQELEGSEVFWQLNIEPHCRSYCYCVVRVY